MYICRHCGLEYKTDEAVMCPRCQAPKGKGNNFCPFCGEQMTDEQKICMNCGVEVEYYGLTGVKSKFVAGLLGIFLGTYGAHNFYLGYHKRAVIHRVFNKRERGIRLDLTKIRAKKTCGKVARRTMCHNHKSDGGLSL